jgi:hypothetical protein
LGADEQPVPSKAGIVVGVIVVRRQAEHDQASSSTSRRFRSRRVRATTRGEKLSRFV